MGKLEQYLIAADNSVGKPQKGWKRKRGGAELTREQVTAIKKGRKALRKEMKAKGLKKKGDFELTASSMGLYLDKPSGLLWLQWLLHGKGLWALLGALLLMLLALFLFSTVTQMRGHFTINMSDGLFKEGFVLSETKDFRETTTHLFCIPAENVPCVSINHLPDDLDTIDGQHNENYFAYTFYCRNEGESTVAYEWSIALNSESKNMPDACWVMIFENGKMQFYAKPNRKTGEQEALPAFGDNSRGYLGAPLKEFSKNPKLQYQTIKQTENFDYVRVVPLSFVSDTIVAEGLQEGVGPGDVNKYTVVIWLEGDDPECNDDLIGGHIGMEFRFQMKDEEDETDMDNGVTDFRTLWEIFWENLKFWN